MIQKLNEIKRGQDIGKKPDAQKFIWAACPDCGITRWVVLLVGENKPQRERCRACAQHLRKGEKRGVAHNRLNLVGQRFTRLVVLHDTGETKHKESLWKCRCDCGNITITTGYSLTSGNTKSCGCYHKIRTRQLFSKSDSVIRINRVLLDYQKRAREKNLSFTLSKEQFKSLIDSDCYYCGAKPSNSFVQHNRPLPVYQGIDRLDNTKGYTPDNVVPACIVCNKMKKALSHDEFILHILKVASRFEIKSPQADFHYETCGGQVL